MLSVDICAKCRENYRANRGEKVWLPPLIVPTVKDKWLCMHGEFNMVSSTSDIPEKCDYKFEQSMVLRKNQNV